MTTKPFAHLADTVKAGWDENTRTIYQAACEAFKAECNEFGCTCDRLGNDGLTHDERRAAATRHANTVARMTFTNREHLAIMRWLREKRGQ